MRLKNLEWEENCLLRLMKGFIKKNAKKKKSSIKKIKRKENKKGLLIVFTGNGKGKTTASLGMALRTIGHGHKVAIIQFIKGGWTTGEEKALKNFITQIFLGMH